MQLSKRIGNICDHRTPLDSTHKRPVLYVSLWCFPKHPFNKQSRCRWFETIWRSYDVTEILNIIIITSLTFFNKMTVICRRHFQMRFLAWKSSCTKILIYYHCSNVPWAAWYLKQSATRLIVLQLVQANITWKWNVKVISGPLSIGQVNIHHRGSVM